MWIVDWLGAFGPFIIHAKKKQKSQSVHVFLFLKTLSPSLTESTSKK